MPRVPVAPSTPKLNQAVPLSLFGPNVVDGMTLPRQGSSTFIIVRTTTNPITMTIAAGDRSAGAFAANTPLVVAVPIQSVRIIQLESAKYIQQGGVFHLNFDSDVGVTCYTFYL